jgi:transposase
MMGSKKRHFASLIQVSLEDLVPADHFYRHLERSLDLSFVREFVQQTYAGGGRPSIDPVVFFKLQLVMFFMALFCSSSCLNWSSVMVVFIMGVTRAWGKPI